MTGSAIERVLVVDDEPLGRRAVTRQLASLLPTAEVREARDGFEALELVAGFAPSLVFLDVEMPELSGFDVLHQLPRPRPKVVFVTAYQEFALRAFEENACDYLVKPFTAQRFAAAVVRASAELDAQARLLALERALASGGAHMTRIVTRVGARTDLVPIDTVSCLVSRGHYTYVYADGREHISELSLIHFEERIDPVTFIRVHRSALVNHTMSARIDDGSPAAVVLRDGQRVPLSRRNRGAVLERLGARPRRGR
jgi:two-component system LytT family response regulator